MIQLKKALGWLKPANTIAVSGITLIIRQQKFDMQQMKRLKSSETSTT